MPEKTDQVQFSLAHCVGHYLGPLQLHRFLVYSIFQCTTGRIQQVFLPAVNTLPVGLYLVFRPLTLLWFFLYQKPSFVGLGSKCILLHGDLEFLLPGYILDMSMIRHVPWCTCVSASCSDL